MGSSMSRLNNKLSFDYGEYLRERSELSCLLRSIASDSASRRKNRTVAQTVAGASSVAAGLAGAVVAVPATFGLSIPAAAAISMAVVGNSMTVASVASSAASFGHGYSVDRDIVRRLENLRPLIESMVRKNEEVNALVQFFRRGRGYEEKVVPSIGEARDKLSKKVSFNEGAKANGLAAWSVLSPGTHCLLRGGLAAQFESEEELEKALIAAADAIDEKTAILRTLEMSRFNYLGCLPTERSLSRGRLTCIDDGGGMGGVGGCSSRFMKVVCFDPRARASVELESDSTNVLRLPEGATNVRVTFHVRFGGGERTPVRKVDRASAKQPWVKSEKGDRVAEVLEFDYGDGVDAVFCVKGPVTHSFVHKAWDFGRDTSALPRDWEWWGDNTESAWREILPDSEERCLDRSKRSQDDESFELGLCGSCLHKSFVIEQVA